MQGFALPWHRQDGKHKKDGEEKKPTAARAARSEDGRRAGPAPRAARKVDADDQGLDGHGQIVRAARGVGKT